MHNILYYDNNKCIRIICFESKKYLYFLYNTSRRVNKKLYGGEYQVG